MKIHIFKWISVCLCFSRTESRYRCNHCAMPINSFQPNQAYVLTVGSPMFKVPSDRAFLLEKNKITKSIVPKNQKYHIESIVLTKFSDETHTSSKIEMIINPNEIKFERFQTKVFENIFLIIPIFLYSQKYTRSQHGDNKLKIHIFFFLLSFPYRFELLS